jgi:hypothetical protein
MGRKAYGSLDREPGACSCKRRKAGLTASTAEGPRLGASVVLRRGKGLAGVIQTAGRRAAP